MSKARDLANAGTALTTVSATELGYLDGVTSAIQTQINTKDSLPSRSGQSGKYLTNNGTDASWGTVSQYSLPSQSGNSGKFLTTNGTSESWGTPTAGEGWDLLVNGTTYTSTSSYAISLTGGYDKYKIQIHFQCDAGGTLYSAIPLRINNSSASEYVARPLRADKANSLDFNYPQVGTSGQAWGDYPFQKDNDTNFVDIQIHGCQNTAKYKSYFVRGHSYINYYGYFTREYFDDYSGIWKNTSAVTSVNLVSTSGTTTGAQVYVWGSN